MEFNRDSSVEYVEMDFDVPVKQLLTEYERIKDRLVTHRPEDGHKDWCAVTLYGSIPTRPTVTGSTIGVSRGPA